MNHASIAAVKIQHDHPLRNTLIQMAIAIEKLTPQQRTWVGLTDDERRIIINDWQWQEGKPYHLCLSIEAKLKEKNT